mmetsp:Transcript_79409/g.256695  ORF Transcript_79409/g.256695 Transcript_79409/m.256695 type:complete len:210 (+) Transcript_79409:402-1031(+)
MSAAFVAGTCRTCPPAAAPPSPHRPQSCPRAGCPTQLFPAACCTPGRSAGTDRHRGPSEPPPRATRRLPPALPTQSHPPLWWPLAQSIVYEAPDGVGVVVVVQDGARVRQDLIQHLTPCRGFFREGDLLGRIGHEGARESRRARHGVLLELEARTLRPQDACNDLFQLRVGICAELQRSTLCGRRLAGGLGSRGLGVACALDSQASDLG